MTRHTYGLPTKPGTPRQYSRGDMGDLWVGDSSIVHEPHIVLDLEPCMNVRRFRACGYTVGLRLHRSQTVACARCGAVRA